MINFISLGGAREIGANCYYLNINGRGILLESGLHPKKKNFDALPNIDFLKERSVDASIISHSHLDHIGSIPFTLKMIPHLRPYMTIPTYYLSEIMLNNAASIISKNLDATVPIYTHDLVSMALQTFRQIEFNKEFYLIPHQYNEEDKITCEFYSAGHILGAAASLIRTNKYKIFYTGDINLSPQLLMKSAELPSDNIDILIMESTLGASEDESFEIQSTIIQKFINSINNVLNNDGSVLIPIFALGKTQEILSLLFKMIKQKSIPDVDIYTGNMSKEISKVYDKFRYSGQMKNSKFELSDIPQKSFPDRINVSEISKLPSIFLAPTGMIDKDSISYDIAKEFLRNNLNSINFVGYVEPESPGFKIMQSKKGDLVFFENNDTLSKVNCSIGNFRFSSHSKRGELIEMIKKLSPKVVVLVHGEYSGQLQIRNEISKLNPEIQVVISEDFQEYNLEKYL